MVLPLVPRQSVSVPAAAGIGIHEPVVDTNTVRDDTNTVRDDTNTVRDDTNTVRDDTNAVRVDTNAVRDDTNAVRDDTNAVRDETNAVVDDTNAVVDDTNAVVDDATAVVDDTRVAVDDTYEAIVAFIVGDQHRRHPSAVITTNEYFTGLLPVSHPVGSLENILAAMDFASAKGIPIVVVQHTVAAPERPAFKKGQPGWELHPEVAKRKKDLVVEKQLPGSFTGTELEAWLREKGIDTVTISGYMTQMCCDTTARQAFHRGFAVEFLSDATGTLAISNQAGSVTAEELHRAILVTQAMLFSNVMSNKEWMEQE